jgi:hypothetical protein
MNQVLRKVQHNVLAVDGAIRQVSMRNDSHFLSDQREHRADAEGISIVLPDFVENDSNRSLTPYSECFSILQSVTATTMS